MTTFESQAGKDAHDQFLLTQYLEELYLVDGRYKPDHPHHGTYTGLFQKYGPGVKVDDN